MFRRIAVVLPLMFALGLSAVAQVVPSEDIYTRLNTGQLSLDPAQWDEIDRKMLFQNMPEQYHKPYTDALAKLLEANLAYWKEHAELFRIIHPPLREEDWDAPEEQSRNKEVLSGNYIAAARRMNREFAVNILLFNTRNGFAQLPQWIKSEDQTEHWNACAEELLFLFDKTTEAFQTITEMKKRQVNEFRQMEEIDPERLPILLEVPTAFWSFTFSEPETLLTDEQKEQRAKWGSYVQSGHKLITIPLTDAQKERIRKDEPLFHSADLLWMTYPHCYPPLGEWEYMQELRNAEREAWKIEATPELAKVALEQEDVVHWDASFTLHQLARAIAERCEGIDITPLQTSSGHGVMVAPGSMVLMSSDADKTKTLSPVPNLSALIQKEKDIIFFARQLTRAEIRDLGEQVVAVPFAKDAIVFLQNKYNPVRNLTQEQYRNIFSGEYKNWKDVGGFDVGITGFVRHENTSSEEVMKTLFRFDIESFNSRAVSIGGNLFFSEMPKRMESPADGGIAYTSYHYDRYMAPSTYTRTMAVDGVFPNAKTIASGEYPLVYECVLVHRKNPGEKVERFVEWLLSVEGQRVVRAAGYVPIRSVD